MKVLIAIPTMGTVDIRFFSSVLSLKKPCQCKVAFESGSLVYMSRNHLALKAIENDFDYIFWLDSDMVFPPETLEMLMKDAESGMDFVSGLYFKRCFPTYPVICDTVVHEMDESGDLVSEVTNYNDYPRDSVFEIAAAGFGCCLTKTDLIKRVAEKYRCSPFEPLPALGEDYSFCKRVEGIGAKMFCDSRVKAGHIGTFIFNESVYDGQTVEG